MYHRWQIPELLQSAGLIVAKDVGFGVSMFGFKDSIADRVGIASIDDIGIVECLKTCEVAHAESVGLAVGKACCYRHDYCE